MSFSLNLENWSQKYTQSVMKFHWNIEINKNDITSHGPTKGGEGMRVDKKG